MQCDLPKPLWQGRAFYDVRPWRRVTIWDGFVTNFEPLPRRDAQSNLVRGLKPVL